MIMLCPLIYRMHRDRVKQGLSLRQLAKITGCSFSTLARLERGEGEPDPHTEERLRRWIFDGEGSAPRVRTPGEQSWFAKMELRMDILEVELKKLAEARKG